MNTFYSYFDISGSESTDFQGSSDSDSAMVDGADDDGVDNSRYGTPIAVSMASLGYGSNATPQRFRAESRVGSDVTSSKNSARGGEGRHAFIGGYGTNSSHSRK